MKKAPIRIVEINVHRSKRNPRLGHAVALLFPCNHNKYLGLTLYKDKNPDKDEYRTQVCRIIKFEDYEIMDKEVCKLCPQDEFWLDDILGPAQLEDLSEVLESMDDGDLE